MKALSSDVKTEKNKASNSPVFLYTIYAYDGTNNLYLAAYDADVVFNGITYSRFPISHDNTAENNSGQIDTIKVSVANVNRVIEGYLESYDLRGKKIDIMTVFIGHLDNPANKVTDTFYIDCYVASQESVEFTLSSKFDILQVELPSRKFIRTYCQWKFKGVECGYAGGTTTCNKTKDACKALSNLLRFGGFPSVPQSRVWVG